MNCDVVTSWRHSFGRSLLLRIKSSTCGNAFLLSSTQISSCHLVSRPISYPESSHPVSQYVKMHTINFVILPITLITLYRAKLSSAATSTPAPYPCPNLDNSSYASATGSNYNIQCSTDYPGNDLPALHTDTFEQCLKACDTYVPGSTAEAHNHAPCVGVSWGAGNPNANCYLKYLVTTVKHNDVGISSGYLANDTLSSSSVTSPRSSQSTTSAPTTGTALAATSTTSAVAQPTSRPNSSSDSHSNVAIGAGVGVSVGVVGSAILASIFYLMRRQIKTRPEQPLELSAEADDEKSDKLHKPSADTRVDELPADNEPRELFNARGPRAELFEGRGAEAEMA